MLAIHDLRPFDAESDTRTQRVAIAGIGKVKAAPTVHDRPLSEAQDGTIELHLKIVAHENNGVYLQALELL